MKDKFFGKTASKRAKDAYTSLKIRKCEKNFILGNFNTYNLISDPKRIGFLFARYKFVSKMFENFSKVLEIGCQEGLGSLVVAKAVKKLVAIDFYKPHIKSCLSRLKGNFAPKVEFRGHDIIDGPINEDFDGIFSLDVIEHIDRTQEDIFMKNVTLSLLKHGVLILGTPSLESQIYASSKSKIGHINCKNGKDFRAFCCKYFNNVFIFGMNDEVVHTGFLPMSQYLIALCVSKKS